jgi:solute carrier family 25 carnitine/acylcarnitine transporter 20/29
VTLQVLLLLLPPQIRGFFRGLSSPLIGGAAETGVNYLVYSRVLEMFKPQQQQQQQQQSLLPAVVQQMRVLEQQQHQQQLLQQEDRQNISSNSSSSEQHLPPLKAVPVAGAVAGIALSVILAPTELIKCRMQVRSSLCATSTAEDCCRCYCKRPTFIALCAACSK